MTGRPMRPRRCQLVVPGSSEKMMAKAAGLEVDQVILDLEDAVAPSAKVAARNLVAQAIDSLPWKARTVSVRINDVETQWCHDDVLEVVGRSGSRLDTVMLTKAKSVEHVRFVHFLLDQLETKLASRRRLGIECLIEEVEGLMNVERIAACSDRLECLVFGMGDYSASQQMQLEKVCSSQGYGSDIWHYPRFRMTLACRAHGIDPVDGPYADFRDTEGYRLECARAKMLGMAGKWAIHPDQVRLSQDAFSPSAQDVALARRQVAAYDEALARGVGAINMDGVMIDAASIRIARVVVDRADLIGM